MIQNTIATSRLTLPFTIICTIALCAYAGIMRQDTWPQLLCMYFGTYLMLVFNNVHALIRVHSRLVSTSFLLFTLMTSTLVNSTSATVSSVLFIGFLLTIFGIYQKHFGVRNAFYAFLFLGAISTQFIQIVFFVPVIWFIMAIFLQASSLKNYIASLFGLALPYCFWGTYTLYTQHTEVLIQHFSGISNFTFVFEGMANKTLILSVLLITLLGIVGIIHFVRYSYNDNIKTRMLYNSLMTLGFATLIFLVLQPTNAKYLLPMLIVCASPFVAHFFTFTKTKITNIFFIVATLATWALTIYNIAY